MLNQTNAVVLAVSDVKRCAQFYSDKLGFRLDQLEEDEAYLTIAHFEDPEGNLWEISQRPRSRVPDEPFDDLRIPSVRFSAFCD